MRSLLSCLLSLLLALAVKAQEPGVEKINHTGKTGPFGMRLRALPADLKSIYEPVFIQEAPANEAVIVKLPDDSLKIFYVVQPARDAIYSIKSSDGSLTWQTPEKEFSLPGIAYYALQALVDKEGELHIVFHLKGEGKGGYRGKLYNLWHIKTSNGCKIWGEPKEFFKGYVGSIRGFLQMKNGRLLVGAGIAVEERTKKPKGRGIDYGWNDTVVFYSDDNGSSWKTSEDRLKIAQDNKRGLTRYGAIEPHLIQLANGKIWMLIRTKNGHLYESFSDDGDQWTEPVPHFVSSDSPAASAILEDGRIVLLLNVCQRWDDLKSYAIGGRETLHAAISSDQGKTWHGFREVLHEPVELPAKGDRGTAYSSAVVSHDKIVFMSGQGEGRKAIGIFDPEWLLQKKASDDFSKGLVQWTAYGAEGVYLNSMPDGKVLKIENKNPEHPTGASWNFPAFFSGSLKMKIQATGASENLMISLTDNFSVVADTLADDNAVYNLKGEKLVSGKWHDLVLDWSSEKLTVSIDGKVAETLQARRKMLTGINYLRLSAPDKNSGLLIQSISVEENKK